METLEDRRLLAVTHALLDGSTARFTGDAAPDTLYLRVAPDHVLEFSDTGLDGPYTRDFDPDPGAVRTLTVSRETRIEVDLAGGADALVVTGTLAAHTPSAPGAGTMTLGEGPEAAPIVYQGVEDVATPFLQQVEYGLKGGLFPTLQQALNTQVWDAPVPLVGTQLRSAAAGQVATCVRAALDGFSVADGATPGDVAAALGRSLAGLLQPGTAVTVTTSPDGSVVTYQVTLTGTRTDTLDVDLALGDEPYFEALLGIDSQARAAVTWTLPLTFGVDRTGGFFVDASAAEDMAVEVWTGLDAGFDGIGRLGVFTARMRPVPGPAPFFLGSYAVDLRGRDGDNRLTPAEFPDLDLAAELSGRGSAALAVEAAFIPDLHTWSEGQYPGLPPSDWTFNLALTTDVTLTYDYHSVDPQDGTCAIEFADIRLDTDEYLGGFFAPVISALKPILAPLKPIVDTLTSPIPGVSDLSVAVSGQQVTWMDLARLAGSPGIYAALHTLSLIETLVNAEVPGREPAGQKPPDLDLGSFQALYHRRTHEITTTRITEPGAPVEDKMKQHNDLYASIAGDLSFPLLEDPKNVFALMRGEADVPLFQFGLDLNFTFFWTTEWPTPIPFLEVRLEPSLGVVINTDVGYDTLGVRTLADALDFGSWQLLNDSLTRNAAVLREGYFLDDHLNPGASDGDLTPQALTPGGVFIEGPPRDDPEMKLFAQLAVGAKLGTPDYLPIEVSVGINFPLRLDILFDLNDLPDRLRHPAPQQITLDGPPTGSTYVEDGFRITTTNAAGFDTSTAGTIAARAGGDWFTLASTRSGEVFTLTSLAVDVPASTTLTFRGTHFGGGTVEQSFPLDPGSRTLTFAPDFTDLTAVSWQPGPTRTDTLVAAWPAGTYPLDPAAFQYDGRVHLPEFETILDADRRALFNAAGEFSAAVEFYLRVYLGREPFTISLVDKTWRLISITLFSFDLNAHLTDAQILDGLVKDPPVLGGLRDGTLTLYMGPEASKRQHTSLHGTGQDGKVDEAFVITSRGPTVPGDSTRGETLEVTYLNTFRQTFEGVRRVEADGGDGDDEIRVDGSVGIPVELRGGAGHDRLVHEGSAPAVLVGGSGNDTLVGGSGSDTLVGGSGDDWLEGRAGHDVLVGDNATVAVDGTVVLAADEPGTGDDTLRGGEGDDRLLGQAGRDLLEGGAGRDTVTGGTGADRYLWDVGSGADTFVELPGPPDEFDQITVGGGVVLRGSGGDAANYRFVDRDDVIMLSNDAGRLRIDTGLETLLLDGVEHVGVAAGGGSDRVTLRSLAGTAVRRVTVDLSQPREAALGEAAGDRVVYEGSEDADTITVTVARQAVPTTVVGSGSFEEQLKEVVQIVAGDASGGTDSITYIVMNGNPDRNTLEIDGRAGDDTFTVRHDPEVASRVQDLIALRLLGGTGNDNFLAPHGSVVIDGGAGADALTVTDDGHSAGQPDLVMTGQALVVAHGSGSNRTVSQMAYEAVESLVLNLGARGLPGNTVRVLGTIPGPVAVHGSADADAVTVIDTRGPLTLDLAGGRDALTVDRAATADGGLRGTLAPGLVRGLGLPSDLSYGGVERLTVVLGPGDDDLEVLDTGTATTVLAGDGNDQVRLRAIAHQTTVHGQGGDDTVTVYVANPEELTASPFAGLVILAGTETLRVQHTGDGEPGAAPAHWRVEQDSVWADRAGDSLAVVALQGAGRVVIAGRDGDTLTVADDVPAPRTVTLGNGTVRVQRGTQVLTSAGGDWLADPAGSSAALLTPDGRHLYSLGSPDAGVLIHGRDEATGDLGRVTGWLPSGKSTGTVRYSQYGSWVAVSGRAAVVATNGGSFSAADSTSIVELGPDGRWTPTQVLPGGGGPVAIDGDTAVAWDWGVYGVRVFERTPGAAGGWTWEFTGTLPVVETVGWGHMVQTDSVSLAISGDTVVVGLRQTALVGDVLVFHRNDGGPWEPIALEPTGVLGGEQFGGSVAIDGDTILVGVPYHRSDPGNPDDRQGAVYVFTRAPSGNWTQDQVLTDPDGTPFAQFGWSVGLDGDTAVVGVPQHNINKPGGGPLGAVFVYERDSSGWWTGTHELTDGSHALGSSVAVSADTIISGTNRDAAFLFVRQGSPWAGTRITPPDAAQFDPYNGFGESVAVSGPTVLVGAPQLGKWDDDPARNTQYTGGVYLFSSAIAAGATSLTLSPDGGHLYALRPSTRELLAFARDASAGTLAPLPGGPDLGTHDLSARDALAASPDGRHLYVSTNGPAVLKLTRDATTGLLSGPDPQGGAAPGPKVMTFSQAGDFAYVAYPDANTVQVFRRDLATGDLTPLPGQTFVDGQGVDGLARPVALALAPDGATLYVAGHDDDALAVFASDTATGELTFLGTARNGSAGVHGLGGVSALVVTDDTVLAAGEDDDALVALRRRADGRLTFLQRLTNLSGGLAGLENPRGLALTPDGRWLYAASAGESAGRPGGLAWFEVDSTPSPAAPLDVGYSGMASLTVRTGGGADVVSIADVAVPLTVQTGGDADRVGLLLDAVPYAVTVETGDGRDVVVASASAGGLLTVNTGADSDELHIARTGPNDRLVAGLGAGDDTARLDGLRLQPPVGADPVVTLDGNAGDDTLLLDAGGLPTEPPAPATPAGTVQAGAGGAIAYESIEAVPGFVAARVDAQPGGPYTLAEGEGLTLRGRATPATNTAIAYLDWDLNRDGLFGEVSTAVAAGGNEAAEVTLTVPWADLAFLNGSPGGTEYRVALRALDSAGHFAEAEATLTVSDTPPDLRIAGEPTAAEDAPYLLHLQSSDPAADVITEWHVYWDWAAAPEAFERVEGNPATVIHRFAAAGPKQVRATARDADGTHRAAVTPGVFGLNVSVLDAVPVLVLAGPDRADEGTPYVLTVAASDPTGDPVSEWVIDWGDGRPRESVAGAAATVTHTYADDRPEAVIQATAISPDGFYQATKAITVRNLVPVLLATGPSTADEGSWYTLTLAASDPGDDRIEAWTIDWGDGAVETVRGDAASIRHRYADDSASQPDGVYLITATAYDEDATPATPYRAPPRTVAVGNVIPAANLAGPATADEGSWYRLTLGPPADPGDDTVQRYLVDWGDGTPVQSVDVPAGGSAAALGVYHLYVDDGVYEVRAQVVDDDGIHPPDPANSLHLAVANVDPWVSAVTSSGPADENSPVELVVQAGDAAGDRDPLTYWFDFDADGQFEVSNATGVARHTYPDNGSYPVTVRVTDDDGGATQVTATLAVRNVAPAVEIGGDVVLRRGDALRRTGSFTDPGADSWTATVDYGDGSGPGALPLNPDGTFTLQHLYADDGTFAVTVTVADDDGGTARRTFTVATTGRLGGTVFRDYDGDGRRDASDPGLPGQIVYLDRDGDGRLSPGEPRAVTDAAGHYRFADLGPGPYTVRLLPVAGQVPTAPAGGAHALTLTGGTTRDDLDFGSRASCPLLPLPGRPADPPPLSHDPDEAFVEELYLTTLGRPADPAGRDFWVAQLRSGAARSAVVAGIWNSAEQRGRQVDAYYQTFLGRPADPAGRDYWIGRLQAGVGDGAVVHDLLTSPEYTAAHPDPGDYVRSLYWLVLRREPDPAGLTHWATQLRAAGAPAVVRDFLRADEPRRQVVEGSFHAGLGRDADPAGLEYWLALAGAAGWVPGDTARALLASDEFFAHLRPGVL